jgi:HEAT repeat protein
MYYLLAYGLLITSPLLAQTSLARIQSHLIIKDFQAAKEDAQKALTKETDNELLHEHYIKALARLGDEKSMLIAWKEYAEKFPQKKQYRELIEEMAWGVLRKASLSCSLPTRVISLLAAFYSHDSRGVHILHQGLNDSTVAVRSVAVLLASQLKDAKLIEKIKQLYASEKVWSVRKEIIPAIGQMKIYALAPQLEALIASEQVLAEEKALAIKSLIALLEDSEIKREAIIGLSQSNRAGLRLLACQAIAHFGLKRDVDQLIQLTNDNHPHVRAAALQAIGLVRPLDDPQAIGALAKSKLSDTDSTAAISAAWLLTLYMPQEGQKAFQSHLLANNQEERLLAAAALSATGPYGSSLALRELGHAQDIYVQLNLALGLIGQRLALQSAAEVLDRAVSFENEKWAWHKEGIFRFVAPHHIKKQDSSDVDNQTTRLEILNILAMIAPHKAQAAIHRFLLERTWGVTGVAAALLLMEGDSASIDIVQQLLEDENLKVRIQAALILSLWGREESAIAVLQDNYWTADTDLKVKILEGIGRIGAMSSVPFLIKALNEPSQFLRIIAAMALIQCLNH